MVWTREALPSVLPQMLITTNGGPGTLQVDGKITSNGTNFFKNTLNCGTTQFEPGTGIPGAPGIAWWADTTDTPPRTTMLIQTSLQFFNGWFTAPNGDNDQLTFAMDPCGTVFVAGRISNSTPANRNSGTLVASLAQVRGNSFYTQTFSPGMFIHGCMDGAGNGTNFRPVFLIGTNGDILVYNCDNTSAGQFDYYFNATYNVYVKTGKYEGTGGGPH